MQMGRFITRKITLPFWVFGLLAFAAVFSSLSLLVLLFAWLRRGGADVVATSLLVALGASAVVLLLEIALLRYRDMRSMRQLRAATREVAKGNFEVQIPEKRTNRRTQLVRDFNRMTVELNKLETFRKDFINNVSHEFKTPTASIYGYAKVLADSQLDVQQQALVDVIVQESERLSKLTSAILRISKLENLEMPTECENYSLDEQLRSVILLLNKKAQAKNLHFNISLQRVYFLGEKELLFQVWQNLLDNAIKYSRPGNTISVLCVKKGGEVVVRIRDRGIGMDEETLSRMYEKFYQGDATHGSEGNGLGLAIVKRVVDLSRGGIDVQSKPGAGCSFTVRLPADGALSRL